MIKAHLLGLRSKHQRLGFVQLYLFIQFWVCLSLSISQHAIKLQLVAQTGNRGMNLARLKLRVETKNAETNSSWRFLKYLNYQIQYWSTLCRSSRSNQIDVIEEFTDELDAKLKLRSRMPQPSPLLSSSRPMPLIVSLLNILFEGKINDICDCVSKWHGVSVKIFCWVHKNYSELKHKDNHIATNTIILLPQFWWSMHLL